MKILTHDSAQFNVAERDNYTFAFTRNGDEEGLYCVVMTSPLGNKSIHVLAPGPKSAISQAHCAWKVDRLPREVQDLIKTHAERVPFLIRGWSKEQF